MQENNYFENVVDSVLNALEHGFVIENKAGDQLYIRHKTRVNGTLVKNEREIDSFVYGFQHAQSGEND